MVTLALGLGVYAYLILSLGLIGLLYKLPVFLVSLLFIVFGLIWFKKNFQFNRLNWLKLLKKNKLTIFLLGILAAQALINFLGAVSPELSFDALWYHLTPPKLYVQNHQIFYIPGWLLWPANLPRVGEMFYTVALLFSNEILAKLIHFSFGLLAIAALFNLCRRYFSLRLSLLGVVSFYTMLLIGWQSTTAYVDLISLFFGILALDLFLKWFENKKQSFLWEAALLTGLAISTKIVALGMFLAFVVLIFLILGRKSLVSVVIFSVLTLLVVLPWSLFSFVHTGSPFFPAFIGQQQTNLAINELRHFWLLDNLIKLPVLLWQATFQKADIVSPVYLIFLPLILIFIWRSEKSIKLVALYSLLTAIFVPSQSNRYLLPSLIGLTLVILSILNNQRLKKQLVKNFLIGVIIFSSLLGLGSRALATRKFLPYLLGRQLKTDFLASNLNFSFGNFYDIDGYFAKNINQNDLVLVYGIHNLYYADFPFVHESWVKPGVPFTHILVGGNQELPQKFGKRLLLYQNPKTRVKLYVFGEKYQ